MRSNTNILFGHHVPIREIHEVEFSSRCNLACRYCPHPKMQRAKADMTDETFAATLRHIDRLCKLGTQNEVSLTGIGEAILHPKFIPWMHEIRSVIGDHRRLVVATNGVALTREMADEMAAARATVFVSTHRPEKAGPAVQMLRAAGVKTGTNTAFVDSAIDWAGQVQWHVSANTRVCEYLSSRWCAVRQDGSVNTCCMDAEGLAPIGHVREAELFTSATKVCEGCHLAVPLEFRKDGQWSQEIIDAYYKQEAQVNHALKTEPVSKAVA